MKERLTIREIEMAKSGKMHDKLNHIIERLAVLETKQDTVNGSIVDHENRLRGVEKRMWAASGGVTVISLLALTKSIGIW